jgi:hypothetical protein
LRFEISEDRREEGGLGGRGEEFRREGKNAKVLEKRIDGGREIG